MQVCLRTSDCSSQLGRRLGYPRLFGHAIDKQLRDPRPLAWEAPAVQTPTRGFWAATGVLGPAEVAPKGSHCTLGVTLGEGLELVGQHDAFLLLLFLFGPSVRTFSTPEALPKVSRNPMPFPAKVGEFPADACRPGVKAPEPGPVLPYCCT